MKSTKRIIFHLFWLAVSVIAAVLLAVSGAAIYFMPSLPNVHALEDYQLAMPLRVYTADHKLIGEFGEQRRTLVTYNQIPTDMVDAFVSAEDQDFFHHDGVDPKGLARAALQLAHRGQIVSGGSTITMQVARNYLLTLDQTFARKIREIMLSLQMERILTKQQIFELYANKIYLGQGAYGVSTAAEVYFGKPLSKLTLPEAATIAGLPKAPSTLNPITDPERSLIRRNWVLLRMRDLGYITDQQYKSAVEAPIHVQRAHNIAQVKAGYVAEMAREFAVSRFGSAAYTNGYTITTTLDSKKQNDARSALIDGLMAYDERHGWRGPERTQIPATLAEAQNTVDRRGLEQELSASPDVERTARQAAERSSTHVQGLNFDVSNWVKVLSNTPAIGPLQPAIVVDTQGRNMRILLANGELETLDWSDLRWAARARGYSSAAQLASRGDLIRVMHEGDNNAHWRLSQIPRVEGAIVVLNPDNGAILALQGGFSFDHSHFNRATQARRQPGSSFKPFIYLSALSQGHMTPATVINDAPIVQNQADGKAWRPQNDTLTFSGPTRLRVGLYESRNLVAIRALSMTGLDKTLNLLEQMGFNRSQLPNGLSLALGSASLSPLEMARGYAEIANGGYNVIPWYISSITRGDNPKNILEEPAAPVVCTQCAPDQTTVNINGRLYPVAKRIADPASVYLLQDMMKDVIRKGTGRYARALNRPDLAAKTGTSNDERDAWFAGFNTHLVATVWVGMDNNASLHEYAARAAVPIWTQFMGSALKGVPAEESPRPDNIVTLRIDPRTGLRLPDNVPGGIQEIFDANNTPAYQQPAVQPKLEDQSGSQGTGSYDAIF
ncbi:Penicillin-binding protein 1A GT51 [Halomonadaceae bacterium LMG 33818]|uniref:penicillin-binding protein 1A n=1 Tax=Cernens ardua TaxID=3402176 RepID=UPI003EDC06A7